MSEAVEDKCPSSSKESEFPFLHLFLLFGLSTCRMLPTCIGEGDLLYSVSGFKCLLEVPSQIHLEIMFYQLSGDLLAQ